MYGARYGRQGFWELGLALVDQRGPSMGVSVIERPDCTILSSLLAAIMALEARGSSWCSPTGPTISSVNYGEFDQPSLADDRSGVPAGVPNASVRFSIFSFSEWRASVEEKLGGGVEYRCKELHCCGSRDIAIG